MNIESIHWLDLTLEQIESLEDLGKKQRYRKNRKEMIDNFIVPLKSFAVNFKFEQNEDQMGTRMMINALLEYFQKMGLPTTNAIDLVIGQKRK